MIFRALIVVVVVLYGPVVLCDETTARKPLPKFLRNPKLAERYLRTRDLEDILRYERVEPVCVQLLRRSKVNAKDRLNALQRLARLRQRSPVSELNAALQSLDPEGTEDVRRDLARLLPRLTQDVLKSERPIIVKWAEGSERELRQAAMIAICQADGSISDMWNDAAKSPSRQRDFIDGFGMLRQASLKAEAFDRVLPLVTDGPSNDVQKAAIGTIISLDGHMETAFAALARVVSQGQHIPACIIALSKIPEDSWSRSFIDSIVEELFEYTAILSIADRASGTGKGATELLGRLISHLPQEKQKSHLRRLKSLRVQTFDVKALKETMSYDETVLVVETGIPVQIIFHNDDIMPHNLVIGSEPEARVELGLLADDMQGSKDAASRGYLPKSPMVLHASKMIQPDVTDTIEFIAPGVGVYPFVCTFPGHWSKMYGAIQVVDEAARFLANNPQLPTADELLGIRKVEWSYDELLVGLDSQVAPRSYKKGKYWFRRASCYSCHKIREEGGTVGPDLTDISKKYKSTAEVLLHIIKPSKSIEDKFASLTVIDDNGKTHQGVVIKRTEEELWIKKNPLEDCEPIVIRIDEIDEEFTSNISPMPENLLNTIIERSEIHDLLAFTISGDNPQDAVFSDSPETD